MTLINYVGHDGTRFEIEVTPGLNLMEVAISNGVRGIDGDCGGNAACATCHVYVAPEWAAKLTPANDAELAMLELTDGIDSTSRLACRIVASDAINGLTLQMPASQH